MPMICQPLYGEFHSTDKHLNEFLKDWNKMRELYWAGTIDEEVYSLWREKTISKYNIPIEAELH